MLTTGIVGIAGVVAGVLAERIARSWGRLSCETSLSSLLVVGDRDDWGGRSEVGWQDADETTKAVAAEYIIGIDLFNGRETPTGLRDVRLELVRDENPPIKSRPEDLATGTPLRAGNLPPGLMTYDKLQVINLPPRQYVHKGLKGRFEREGAEALTSRRWRSIDFVGELPGRSIFSILGSKTYRKTITEPSNWE